MRLIGQWTICRIENMCGPMIVLKIEILWRVLVSMDLLKVL